MAEKKKATRQLRVALSPGTEKLAEVKAALIEKGHEVTVLPELADYDLVLGLNAHRLTAANAKMVVQLIKATRLRKYGQRGSKQSEEYETEG